MISTRMSKRTSPSTQRLCKRPASSRTAWCASCGRKLARSMAEIAHSFDDSTAYERFVGHWGRAAGAIFLDWVAPPKDARWLDVGCGTGLFTELILDTQSPQRSLRSTKRRHKSTTPAVSRPLSERISELVMHTLPFPDATFDVVASALVINFIPDRPRALSEMRRVTRPGGIVAGYVWDFAPELSPSGPFRLGLREAIADLPVLPGTADSRRRAQFVVRARRT